MKLLKNLSLVILATFLFLSSSAFSSVLANDCSMALDENIVENIANDSKIFCLNSQEQVEYFVKQNENAIIYFTSGELTDINIKTKREIEQLLKHEQFNLLECSVAYVSVEDVPNICEKYKIRYLPTFLIFIDHELSFELANRQLIDLSSDEIPKYN